MAPLLRLFLVRDGRLFLRGGAMTDGVFLLEDVGEGRFVRVVDGGQEYDESASNWELVLDLVRGGSFWRNIRTGKELPDLGA